MRRQVLHALTIGLAAVVFANCGGGDGGGSTGGGATAGTDAGDASNDSTTGGGGAGGGTGASGGTSAGGTDGSAGAAGGGAAGASGSSGAAGNGGAAGGGGIAGAGTGGVAGSGTGGAAGAGATSGTGGTGGSAFDPTCYVCHGTTGSPTPAPPKDTSGNTTTAFTGVGAHQSHLGSSNWHKPVTCVECHHVPQAIGDPGHVDTALPAEVIWDPSDLANADSATPSWGGVTCAGVYCHGPTLTGASGANTTPTWTTVDGSQKACGTACHALPPGGAHPGNTSCQKCHSKVITSFNSSNPANSTWKDPNLHIDGKVDLDTLNCTSCHGDAVANDPSPPLGTSGETLTSDPAVGAHQEHLAGANWHRQVVCTDCHDLPTNVLHANGVPDFGWGGPSKNDSANPSYSTSSVTCSGTYCHGSTLMGPTSGGSTKTSPVWNTVNGTYDACGSSCHTNPPGDSHPVSTDCPQCHGAVISTYTPGNPAGNVWADASKHVDGQVQVSGLDCTSCHGNAATNNPAPPTGTAGETLPSQPAVGTHAQHLANANWHRQVQCTDCHNVPSSVTHSNGTTDFNWGGPSALDGASPQYDGNTVTCAGVYCHGTTLFGPNTGSVLKTPVWTSANGTYDACGGACHTNPPGDTHPASTNCPTCHGAVISTYTPGNPAGNVWANAGKHIDGTVDVVTMTCTSCHGNAGANDPSPPLGSKGETLTTQSAVGAHQAHLSSANWHKQVACTDCHTVPTSTSHSNGVDDFTWSTLSTGGNTTTPSYNGTSFTCSGAYCHGATLAGPNTGTVEKIPVWTTVNGTYDACGSSCHTNPPGGTHPTSTACPTCHGAVISTYTPGNPAGNVWANADKHIDGNVDVSSLTCTSCHGNKGANDPSPPLGSKGETLTTQSAVGAHQAHLASANWHKQVACTDCHIVPASTLHSNGVDDFNWSTLSTGNGATTPSYNGTTCSGAYCHGVTLAGPNTGTVEKIPVWTTVNGTYDACGGACHTNPPGGTHPTSTACPTCHGAVISTYVAGNPNANVWANAGKHIDGNVDVSALTCTSCHGNTGANDPSPPVGSKGETLTTQAAVGAHQAHLASANWHKQVACTDCHTVPTSTSHSNGVDDFTWSTLSTGGGSTTPSYNGTSFTCSGAYCHGVTLAGPNSGTVEKIPVWTTVNGTYDACGGACHTNPPGGTHPTSTACPTCHSAVISTYVAGNPNANVWANAGKHVDGNVDVSLTCTSCHGNTNTNDPAPPVGSKGETLTSQAAVGAHQQHLAASTWHNQVACTDCHTVPASVSHSNGVDDFTWSTLSTGNGTTTPSYNGTSFTCSGAYCHGSTLMGPNPGGSTKTSPVWTTVNGTYDACGSSCHTNPPGGTHPASTACPTCHGAVISTYVPGNPSANVWANAGKHVDGNVDVSALTCTSCHGNTGTNDPAPPFGSQGETLTSQPAVGAHQQHLSSANWHRDVQCTDCHTVPLSTMHSNGVDDFTWSTLATGSGSTTPSYNGTTYTCSGVYCHGTSLMGPNPGGSTKTSPVWTTVNGTYDACGSSCHTNPPGGTHYPKTDCPACHSPVITTYTAGNPLTNVWADEQKHVNGTVELSMSCTSCHGTGNNPAPPVGVGNESATNTLAVGRHTAHLTASSTHVAFACGTCHTVPASGDTAHAAQYVPTVNLSTAGHHGDVTFSAPATGMTWNVNATQGAPVTARGTCIGACHSNGRGGNPVVIPYWAGGTWNTGSCGNCHSASPSTGEHNRHVNNENLACSACHPGANTSTHMNGQWDVFATITGPQGGSVTTTAPGGFCGTNYGCKGSCHNHNHSSNGGVNPECW